MLLLGSLSPMAPFVTLYLLLAPPVSPFWCLMSFFVSVHFFSSVDSQVKLLKFLDSCTSWDLLYFCIECASIPNWKLEFMLNHIQNWSPTLSWTPFPCCWTIGILHNRFCCGLPQCEGEDWPVGTSYCSMSKSSHWTPVYLWSDTLLYLQQCPWVLCKFSPNCNPL